jgi:hypothetical protein
MDNVLSLISQFAPAFLAAKRYALSLISQFAPAFPATKRYDVIRNNRTIREWYSGEEVSPDMKWLIRRLILNHGRAFRAHFRRHPPSLSNEVHVIEHFHTCCSRTEHNVMKLKVRNTRYMIPVGSFVCARCGNTCPLGIVDGEARVAHMLDGRTTSLAGMICSDCVPHCGVEHLRIARIRIARKESARIDLADNMCRKVIPKIVDAAANGHPRRKNVVVDVILNPANNVTACCVQAAIF